MSDSDIFEGRIEAFSYAGTSFVSLVIPTIISFCIPGKESASENTLILVLTLFINFLSMIRTSLLLYKFKKVHRIFWIKRAFWSSSSFITAVYSLSMLMVISRNIPFNALKTCNVIAFSLLVIPGIFISLIEGVKFSAADFKENTTKEEIKIVSSKTVDV